MYRKSIFFQHRGHEDTRRFTENRLLCEPPCILRLCVENCASVPSSVLYLKLDRQYCSTLDSH